MNRILTLIISLLLLGTAFRADAQASFIEYQKTNAKLVDIFRRYEDTLSKQFKAKGLKWPSPYLYIRSFKYDSQLEVWSKNKMSEPYQLFKVYKVCALAGTLGPKRLEGDYQVPEGFYYINEFNPNSVYHLSLGLNYPNASDRYHSDSIAPGGDIYIHGSCVTEGCIPITNNQIEELYVITAMSRNTGQDFIPVHIYPIRFNNRKSHEYLDRYLVNFAEYKPLSSTLKTSYLYFEKHRQLPVVMIDTRGNYALNTKADDFAVPVYRRPKASRANPRNETLSESEIVKVVEKMPVFPGGHAAFQKYLDKLGKDMAKFLDEGQARAFVLIEFVVDAKGQVIMPRIVRGGNEDLQLAILDQMDRMPAWAPARIHEKAVAYRLKQTLVVEP